MFKSSLKLNKENASLQSCQNIKLSVKIATLNGFDTLRTFNNVKLFDDKESSVEFTLPMEPTSANVNISCSIVSMTGNKESINHQVLQNYL